MTYREYKNKVIDYLMVCLEIETKDRFAELQWNRIKDAVAPLHLALVSETTEFNLILTSKYLRSERARLYSAIDKDILRETTPRELRQTLVTDYLKDVTDHDFLNAIRATNCRAGSRNSVKYYLVGGVV